MWDPIDGGDYSSWRSQFDEKIHKHCLAPGVFELGDTSTSFVSFFQTLSSREGATDLLLVLNGSSISDYLLHSKGVFIGYFILCILLLVFGLLYLIYFLTPIKFKVDNCLGTCSRRLFGSCWKRGSNESFSTAATATTTSQTLTATSNRRESDVGNAKEKTTKDSGFEDKEIDRDVCGPGVQIINESLYNPPPLTFNMNSNLCTSPIFFNNESDIDTSTEISEGILELTDENGKERAEDRARPYGLEHKKNFSSVAKGFGNPIFLLFKTWGMIVAVGIALLVLFGTSVSMMVFAMKISYGVSSVQCDFWLSMKAYYFGTSDLMYSQYYRYGTSAVVMDWKGSAAQIQEMNDLIHLVDVKNTTCPGQVCCLCSEIVESYNGTGNSLVSTLTSSKNAIVNVSGSGVLLLYEIEKFISSLTNGQLMSRHDKLVIPDNLTIPMRIDKSVEFMLGVYSDHLQTAVNGGLEIFDTQLAETLSSQSSILTSSYDAASTALSGIADVDRIQAMLIEYWDQVAVPNALKWFKGVMGLGLSAGILGILVSLLVGVVSYRQFWFNQKRHKNAKSSRMVTLLLISLALIVILGALSSSLLLLAGSIGLDGCNIINKVIYEEGNWTELPLNLLNESLSISTNMETLLDTCVKETGHGDAALALGIRDLLESLHSDVVSSEEFAVRLVDSELNLKFKAQQTKSLTSSVKRVNSQLYMDKLIVTHPEGVRSDRSSFTLRSFPGLSYLLPFPEEISIPNPCFSNDLFSLSSATLLSMVKTANYCLNDIFVEGVGVHKGLIKLQEVAKEVGAPYTSFCMLSLRPSETFKCENIGLDGSLMIDGSRNSDGKFNSDVFQDEKVKQMLERFKDESGNYGEMYESVFNLLLQLQTIDQYLLTPTASLDILNSPIPAPQQELKLFPQTVKMPNGRFMSLNSNSLEEISWDAPPSFGEYIEAALPMLKCDLYVDCNVRDLLDALGQQSSILADDIENNFKLSSDRIQTFVFQESVGKFREQLDGVEKNLKHNNCQFLGTSFRAGVQSGICNHVFPSVATIGLLSLFSLLSSLALVVLFLKHLSKSVVVSSA